MIRLAIVMCSLSLAIICSTMFNAEAAGTHTCKTSSTYGDVSWTCPDDKRCCYDGQANKTSCIAPGFAVKSVWEATAVATVSIDQA